MWSGLTTVPAGLDLDQIVAADDAADAAVSTG
jgi:hypothetical protein